MKVTTMNVVRLLNSKILGIESISSSGTIICKTEKLTDEDIAELSHLRVNVSNGHVFDDREFRRKLWQD